MAFDLPWCNPALADAARPELLTGTVSGLIDSLSLIMGLAGISVMMWGAYGSLVRLIATETVAARGQPAKAEPPTARPAFAWYLLMGLEFLIAASAIKLLVAPDWHNLAVLGAVAVIRTFLSLSQRWEAGKGLSLKDGLGVLGRTAASLEIRNGVSEMSDREALAPVHSNA
jgi:uncharacterized membrane protein